MTRRRKSTDWQAQVRARLKAWGLPRWEEEWAFHPARQYRLDFAWPEWRVAIEMHGQIYGRGRHVRPHGFHLDRRKMNEALVFGWSVLEITPFDLDEGKYEAHLKRDLFRLLERSGYVGGHAGSRDHRDGDDAGAEPQADRPVDEAAHD